MAKAKTSAVESFAELRRALAARSLPPVTLLYGVEDYLLEQAQHAIEEAYADPATRDFNFTLVYGSETDVGAVVRDAMSFPVMAERRLIIVREFEKMRGTGTAADDNPFLHYIAHPSETTALVLIASKAEFNRHPYVALKKHALCLEFAELDDAPIASWLIDAAKKSGVSLEGEAAEMLASLSAGSLRAASAELEKLMVYLEGAKERRITTREVERVSCGDERFTVFGLLDAIGARDKRAAMTMLEKMLTKGEEPLMMLAMLSRYTSQLARAQSIREQRVSQGDAARSLGVPPFVVKKLVEQASARSRRDVAHALQAVAEAELSLKSRATDARVVMTMLVRDLAGT